MVACARAVTLAGLVPVFVDVLPGSMNLDPVCVGQTLRHLGSGEVRALLVVHTYGRQANLAALHQLAAEYSLCVVEDLAEAHGIRPHPDSAAACWSFYRNKIVAGEEGGAVYFPLESVARIARSLKTLGMGPVNNYCHIPRGHNYRLAECLADIIRSRLRNWRQLVQCRRQVETWFNEAFTGAGLVACVNQTPREAVWVYDFQVPPEAQRAVIEKLTVNGFEPRYGFVPMTSQTEYFQTPGCNPVAHTLARRVVYLPVHPLHTRPGHCQRAAACVQATLANL
jgi:dTDP-4-amino-4,6-dideoxygalactose transaminase